MNLFKLPFNKSLVFQMILGFLLVAVLPLFLCAYLSFIYCSDQLSSSVQKSLRAVAQYQSRALQETINHFFQNTILLAETPTVNTTLKVLDYFDTVVFEVGTQEEIEYTINKQCFHILNGIKQKIDADNIFLIGLDGKMVYDVNSKGISFLNSDDTVYYPTIERTFMLLSPQVSDFEMDMTTQKPVLFFTAPVFDEKRFLGIVGIGIKPEAVYNVISGGTGLDSSGETVISQYKNDLAIILNPTRNSPTTLFREDIFINEKNSAMAMALSGARGFGIALDYLGKPVLAAWEYLPQLRWGLVVKKNLEELQFPINSLKYICFSIAGLALILAISLAIFTAKGILNPIFKIVQFAQKISEGNLSYTPEPIKINNEIGVLASCIYGMVSYLRKNINTVKESSQNIVSVYLSALNTFKTQANDVRVVTEGIYKAQSLSSRVVKSIEHTKSNINLIEQELQKTDLQTHIGLACLNVINSTAQHILKMRFEIEDNFKKIVPRVDFLKSNLNSSLKLADRIHLLSLNTAIEASQISSSQLGFKLVAQELLNLSNNIEKTSQVITNETEEMDCILNSGFFMMERFFEAVNTILKEVSTTHDSLNKLISSSTKLPQELNSIILKVQDQLSFLEQLNQLLDETYKSVQACYCTRKNEKSVYFLEENSTVFQNKIAQLKT